MEPKPYFKMNRQMLQQDLKTLRAREAITQDTQRRVREEEDESKKNEENREHS
jgi:hypothetical protein